MNKASSRLPLESAGSFQVCKKPYQMDFLETSSSTTSASEAIKIYDEQYLDINPKSTSITTTPLLAAELNEDHKSKVEKGAPDHKIPNFCNGGAISGDHNDNIHGFDDQESEKVQVINGVQFRLGRKIDPNMEPKKLKR